MATYREMVYMVLDELKLFSDDSSFTEEHVRFLLDKYRMYILKQQYEKEKKEIQFRSLIIEEQEAVPQKEKSGMDFLEKQKNKILERLLFKWKEWTDWSLELKNPLLKKEKKNIYIYK